MSVLDALLQIQGSSGVAGEGAVGLRKETAVCSVVTPANSTRDGALKKSSL